MSRGGIAVLVPVKAFAEAKLRLAGVLDETQRQALARSMAEQVLLAAGRVPSAVVCDDAEVAAWAEARGAEIIWAPGRGLNGAVEAGVAALAAAGATRVIVAHADLPLASSLEWVAGFGGVTLVPDRRDEGTNVICVPTGAGFRFSYGTGSRLRHGAEAIRLGLPLRVVREPGLGHDVDVPADLAAVPA